jgi:hypothetical protein
MATCLGICMAENFQKWIERLCGILTEAFHNFLPCRRREKFLLQAEDLII